MDPVRTERDTNTQLAQPLADRIGGQAEGAGDREQQSKSAKEAGRFAHIAKLNPQCYVR